MKCVTPDFINNDMAIYDELEKLVYSSSRSSFEVENEGSTERMLLPGEIMIK